jgi:DNA-directed RNA polymerase specialized sigma subunit
MIRNEAEYKEAVERIKEEKERLATHKLALKEEGLDSEQIKRLTDPIASFHEQLVDDVRSYERLSRGEFEALKNLHGLGRMLVGLRIYRGLSQRQLAERLGVDPSQISRDERNEYHNISVGRVSRILDALGVDLISTLNLTGHSPDENKRAA